MTDQLSWQTLVQFCPQRQFSIMRNDTHPNFVVFLQVRRELLCRELELNIGREEETFMR